MSKVPQTFSLCYLHLCVLSMCIVVVDKWGEKSSFFIHCDFDIAIYWPVWESNASVPLGSLDES